MSSRKKKSEEQQCSNDIYSDLNYEKQRQENLKRTSKLYEGLFSQYSTLYADYSLDNSHKLVSLLRVDSGTLRYYTSNSSGTWQAVSPASITNGLWYFVSVTVSGTLSSPTTSIFLNGTTFNNSLSALSSTPDTTATHSIGGNIYANEGFNGNISQLSIYNRALSQQEVLQNYNATKKRYV